MDETCKQLNISYVVFNTSWDDYLLQRGSHNEGTLFNTAGSAGTSGSLYLTYLRNSLASLAIFGMPAAASIEIWVLELVSNSFCDRLRAALKGVLPEDRYRIRPVEAALVEHLIDFELQQPPQLHKSPNKIHEFLLYYVMASVKEPYLFIPDVDTLFLKAGLIECALGLLRSNPLAASCSFMDRPREIQRPTDRIIIPERMHTVALFFEVAALRALVDLEQDLALQLDFSSRTGQLDDEATRQFFVTQRHCDTLSFLTELLKQGESGSHLVDLNARVTGYFEASAMTLGCESFLHGKYLDPNLHRIFQDNFARFPETSANYQRTVNFCLSLPAIGS